MACCSFCVLFLIELLGIHSELFIFIANYYRIFMKVQTVYAIMIANTKIGGFSYDQYYV